MTRSSLRVLIVDDSGDDAYLIVHALSEGGARPVVDWTRVAQPDEMLLALEREWDVVLLDWCMVGWDGEQALAMLQDRKAPPVIVVSGSMPGDAPVARAMALGAAAFVGKHDLESLTAVIDRVLLEAGGSLLERTAAYLLGYPELAATIVDALPVAVLAVSARAGMIRLANYEAEVLTGYERSELLDGPVARLVPDASRAAHALAVASYLAAPAARPMRGQRLRRKDGSEIAVEILLKPVRAVEGVLTIVVMRPRDPIGSGTTD